MYISDLSKLLVIVNLTVISSKTIPHRVRRNPDGGQRKFSENLRSGRSGGRVPNTNLYSGSCDNTGFSCGSPDESVLKYIGFERVPKVRGGHCTEQGAVPWTVQIQVKEQGRYTHRCGGSLISDRFVVTASHCFGGLIGKEILVILGQNDFTNDEDPGEIVFQVEKYWLHEQFQKEGPYSHDIALLKLQTKGDGCGARYTRSVSPICLPNPWTTFNENTTCVVSGWGKTRTYDSIHGECLRAAEIPLVDHGHCKKMLSWSSQHIIDEMLCAGRVEGGVDACKGDSGGPLVCKENEEDDHYVLAGVISWGLGCGKAHTPSVFTNVVHYLDWIKERIQD